MGACRFLNVLFGLSVAGAPLSPWLWTAPVVMGLYTAVITYLARDEVGGSSRQRAERGVMMMMVLLGLLVIAMSVMAPRRHFPDFVLVLPFLAFVVVRGKTLFRPLLTEPSPPNIGRAIGGGILLMPAIDATMVAGAGHTVAALIVFALALPAALLKRWYYMT
jgi:hypothetical protein